MSLPLEAIAWVLSSNWVEGWSLLADGEDAIVTIDPDGIRHVVFTRQEIDDESYKAEFRDRRLEFEIFGNLVG